MARSNESLLQAIILFCCLGNLLGSKIRDRYSTRLQAPSFTCLTTSNASASFRNHVDLLLSDFKVRSSLTKYYNTSIGSNPDTVYDYFMCRADISYLLCNICILAGTQFVTEEDCEHTDGILFSEMCIFQYSNYSMNGLWEPYLNSSFDYLEANVSNYEQFNQTLSPTLEALIEEAAFGTNKSQAELGFATMEANVTVNQTIYSLAQCTPDILGTNCSRCLHSALSTIRSSANGSPGAISIYPKCQIRYDNISFYHQRESNFNKGERFTSPDLLAHYTFVLILLYYWYLFT